MADPVAFLEANTVWKGWPADETRSEVMDLHAHKDDRNQSISCWRMSWRERIRILFTGRVWLSVMGEQHPPVCVMGETPFLEVEE